MAGKPGRSGRRKKPDVLKLASGTYREDRDGNPERKPKATGMPERPKLALPEARAFWDRYVPQLVAMGVAKSVDTPRLQNMCELWALLRRSTKAVNTQPLDKDARIAFAEYSRQFALAADQFGMTPAGRSRIQLPDSGGKPAIQGRQRG